MVREPFNSTSKGGSLMISGPAPVDRQITGVLIKFLTICLVQAAAAAAPLNQLTPAGEQAEITSRSQKQIILTFATAIRPIQCKLTAMM